MNNLYEGPGGITLRINYDDPDTPAIVELDGATVGRALAARSAVFATVADLLGRFDLLAAPAAQVAPFPVELEFPTAVDGRIDPAVPPALAEARASGLTLVLVTGRPPRWMAMVVEGVYAAVVELARQ